MHTIRKMREADADAVRRIDVTAFGALWRQLKGEAPEWPPRTPTNVLACLEKDPDGCFVAEEGDRVVGFIFSRTWGGVGWFGTFAVLPERQGCGIGTQLIAASLDYLRRDPDRVVGLETLPDSPLHANLYMRLGFRPRLPTFLLDRSLDEPAGGETGLPRWSAAGAGPQARWLADLRQASGWIRPNLDYTKEVLSTTRHGLGETLVLTREDTAIGFSTVGLVSPREEPAGERAHVEVLALHPVHTDDEAFRTLLAASEALARDHGRQVLTLTVNGRHAWALEQLLERGYRVRQERARMVLRSTDAGPATDHCVNLSRWAG